MTDPKLTPEQQMEKEKLDFMDYFMNDNREIKDVPQDVQMIGPHAVNALGIKALILKMGRTS